MLLKELEALDALDAMDEPGAEVAFSSGELRSDSPSQPALHWEDLLNFEDNGQQVVGG